MPTSVFCSSTVSPSTCVMTSLPTSFLLAMIFTFSCLGLDATSKRLRCPLTCRCSGNYSNSIVTCSNSYLTDIPQLQAGVWRCLFFGNNITRLRAGAFSEPRRLRYMHLSKNNIRFIEERAFQGLTSLEMLHLSEESLSSFEDGIFRFFTNLTELNMRVKEVDIPQTEICLLKRLRKLQLSLFQFPSARFRHCLEKLTQLWMLSLDSVQQSNISRATFYPFRRSLTNLLLINCGLRRLHVDMFNDLSNLVVLELQRNEITDLPSNIFASLTRLRQLDISGNKLKVISPALLRPLRSLINLNIGHNTHVNITFGEEFLNMTQLHKIVLNGIKLTSLNNDTFRHLRNSPLIEVDMSTCSLRTISRGAFLPLRNLTILSLDYNPLNASVLHDVFYGVQGAPLHELRISNTNVRALSPTLFEGLNNNNIKLAAFINSQISAIKRGSFHNLRTISELDLSANKITTIDDYSFEDLTMLSRLTLDRNSIVELRSAKRLGISPGLTTLSMARNSIKEVNQESLLGYGNLTNLYLHGNNIRKINANAFTPTPRLEILCLYDNRIHYISPRTFDSLPYLRLLRLNHNRIQLDGASLFQVCLVVLYVCHLKKLSSKRNLHDICDMFYIPISTYRR